MVEHHFCLLVNPYAGKGRTLQVLAQIKQSLGTLPIHFYTVITETVDHAKEVATKAVQNNEAVVALGGDGTVRAIANVISELQGKLAIIPAGRGNDLVRSLNIPLDPVAACKAIAQRNPIAIDMAKINGQFFLGICSLGLDSIANSIASQTTLFKGSSAYLYGGLKALLRWQHTTFNLEIDGKKIEHKGYTVAIANSQSYGGGMYLAPHASLQDGLLDIILIGKVSKLKVLLNIPRLFSKSIGQAEGISFLQGKHIKIFAEEKYTLYADGDPISSTPIEISVMPRALSVYVPVNS